MNQLECDLISSDLEGPVNKAEPGSSENGWPSSDSAPALHVLVAEVGQLLSNDVNGCKGSLPIPPHGTVSRRELLSTSDEGAPPGQSVAVGSHVDRLARWHDQPGTCSTTDGTGAGDEPDYTGQSSTPFQFIGDHGEILSFSPIFVNGCGLALWGNETRGATAFAAPRLRWVSRHTLEQLYRSNGFEVAEIDALATILGTPMYIDPSTDRALPMPRFGAIYLVGPDDQRIDGRCLGDDLYLAPEGTGPRFAFLGVPPSRTGEYFTLYVEDEAGQRVNSFTQRIVPVAGGVAVLGGST